MPIVVHAVVRENLKKSKVRCLVTLVFVYGMFFMCFWVVFSCPV